MKSTILWNLSLWNVIAAGDTLWPSKFSQLEDLLYLQEGYGKTAFGDLATPCGFTQGRIQRQTAAEWIRVAFHDMITYNKTSGMGGLDGSILFEIDRVENKGDAFNNTFSDFASAFDIRTSLADLIAAGLVVAAGNCGEMNIPLRAGRVDAMEAGPKGVPEATTDLKTTMNRFLTAGFDQGEMISLIACGHTLGGVHSNEHPEIVTTGTPSPENKPSFDSTSDAFDNAVMTEYLNGKTQNPLVVSLNVTQRSDLRVFASDKNVTMKKLSDPTYFKSRCATLFSRIINTVPQTVSLSESIKANTVKPYVDKLELTANNTIAFSGRIRVRVTDGAGFNAGDLTVTLSYKDRTGRNVSASINTRPATFRGGSASGLGESFTWFEFDTQLNATAGISSFIVNLAQPSTKRKLVYDNVGQGGYPLNSRILYQQRQSCIQISGKGASTKATTTIVAAVYDEGKNAKVAPQVTYIHRVPRPSSRIPALQPESFGMKQVMRRDGFVFWQMNVSSFDLASQVSTFDLHFGDTAIEYLQTPSSGIGGCEAL